MSVLVLKEKLNFTASSGIVLCIIGAVIIVLHGPTNTETKTIPEFFSKVLAPGFLVYSAIVLIILLYMVFKVGPKYGHVHPAVFLTITAIGGSYLVSSAQGFGAAIVYSIQNWQTDNQFLLWPIYPLGVFVVCTALFQVNYLNKALAHFSASIVTPLNYVFFSFATMATTAVLYQGFDVQDAKTGITLLLGFLVIVIGVSLLFQYNLKVNKMTISRNVEDINDEEFNIEQLDVNPISLMAQTFPLHPETSRRNSKMSQRKASHIENSSIMDRSEYVRHESTIKPAIVVHEPATVQPILPVVSISQQIQQRLEINNLHHMPRISEGPSSVPEQSLSVTNTPAYSTFPDVQIDVKPDAEKQQAEYSQII
ncbi:hypothetical protein HDV06_004963 [Boothiomyces sp. JEL0866]|nr:hypothetical protein HDV06_004930 [Boothiomyces sp. JEL0866]KAJ3325206.1 hypothetical protein HDV06_004963 [Boothiomyces sp. JEL0866]